MTVASRVRWVSAVLSSLLLVDVAQAQFGGAGGSAPAVKRAAEKQAVAAGGVRAMPAQPAGGLVLRVYDVGDLSIIPANYPYRITSTPTIQLGRESLPTTTGLPVSGGGFGGGGFGGAGAGFGGSGSGAGQPPMGGMPGMRGMSGMSMGMPGGGASNTSNEQSGLLRETVDEIQAVIRQMIHPESWANEDIGAQMYGLGTSLIVRQTPAAHSEIAELFEQLRSQGGSARTVSIKANWLFLDAAQFDRLREALGSEPIVEPPSDPAVEKAAGEGPPVYSAEKFKLLTSEASGYSGQITCFEGQTVHLVSGRGTTVIDGLTPVVSAGTVAVDPEPAILQAGAMLQVTPRRGATESVLVVDVHSIVTQPEKAGEPAEFSAKAPGVSEMPGGGKVPPYSRVDQIDRVNVIAQQLSTTVQVRVGRPSLVGGLTFDPHQAADPDQKESASRRLYLTIEVSRD